MRRGLGLRVARQDESGYWPQSLELLDQDRARREFCRRWSGRYSCTPAFLSLWILFTRAGDWQCSATTAIETWKAEGAGVANDASDQGR